MKQFILFSFIIFSIPITASGQEDTAILTVMTYNIYHGELPYDPGKSNIKAIANLINEIKPDLVALQEVDSMTNRTMGFNSGNKMNLMADLGKLTGMTGYFAKAIDFSEGGYGEGILSRHPTKFITIQLPTPVEGEGRSLALAEVTLPNGNLITFAGTHLCHEFEENRIAQTKAIKQILESIAYPTILAGDFNFTPSATPYAVLSEKYIDAAEITGNFQPTYSYKEPQNRIDYIWLSKPGSWEVLEMDILPVDFSDHMPVVIKVRMVN